MGLNSTIKIIALILNNVAIANPYLYCIIYLILLAVVYFLCTSLLFHQLVFHRYLDWYQIGADISVDWDKW